MKVNVHATGRPTITRSCTGAALGATLAASLTWALGTMTVDGWHGLIGPAAPAAEDILAVTAAALATLIAAWLGVSTTISFLAALPGAVGEVAHRVSERIAPPAIRRLVGVVLGGALVASAPGLAVASPGDSGGMGVLAARHTLATRALPDLDPRFLAVDSPGPLDPHFVPVGKPASTSAFSGSYVVRRGDSLWHIAARELPTGATVAQIAARWQQWYAANRATIGPDPDRLEVGQQLQAPTAVAR
jgi:nucleoid-associated protein YgaU